MNGIADVVKKAMKTIIVIASALVAASCSVEARMGLEDRDLWGNWYPPECAGSLDDVVLPIVTRPRAEMPKFWALCEMCNWPEPGVPIGAHIVLRDDLYEHEKPSAIKHEKCHRKLWLLGKNPYWHK